MRNEINAERTWKKFARELGRERGRSALLISFPTIAEPGTGYNSPEVTYRKIPIISPVLIFGQKAFLLALFSWELIFGGACYRNEFSVSNWLWLVNKNS